MQEVLRHFQHVTRAPLCF